MSKKKKLDKAKRKLTKIQEAYQLLQKRYNEMDDYLQELVEADKHNQIEMDYLRGFISYKSLDDEYTYFKEHAHEEKNPDLPFPSLML